MGKFRDLTGQRFSRLLVVSLIDDYVSPKGYHKKRWKCKCDCGKEIIVWSGNLLSGHTKSCGCIHEEKLASGNIKHGLCHSRIYNIWSGIIDRCENPKSQYYYAYGGKGVSICSEWRNSPAVFYQWSITHGYDDSLSIDRIDNDGDYCPENCRWATRLEQANNTSRNRRIEYNGEIKTLAQWARDVGIHPSIIADRLKLGWSVEDALTVPAIVGNRYSNIKKSQIK